MCALNFIFGCWTKAITQTKHEWFFPFSGESWPSPQKYLMLSVGNVGTIACINQAAQCCYSVLHSGVWNSTLKHNTGQLSVLGLMNEKVAFTHEESEAGQRVTSAPRQSCPERYEELPSSMKQLPQSSRTVLLAKRTAHGILRLWRSAAPSRYPTQGMIAP